jgi:hypothetical protein
MIGTCIYNVDNESALLISRVLLFLELEKSCFIICLPRCAPTAQHTARFAGQFHARQERATAKPPATVCVSHPATETPLKSCSNLRSWLTHAALA